VKQICRRENSDGVDICNTQNALVEDCFLRNNDDEVCVKTTSPPPAEESKNILVHRCVVWNERARGLGITSETRANISNVCFRDCDILHDFSAGGDCAALAVLVSDSGTISDILFEDIRINDTHEAWFNGWIGADMWGHDASRGNVKNLMLRNITVVGVNRPGSKLSGYNATHLFQNVVFENLCIGGKRIDSLESGGIKVNEYVRGVKIVK
jgi:polygalacturonase